MDQLAFLKKMKLDLEGADLMRARPFKDNARTIGAVVKETFEVFNVPRGLVLDDDDMRTLTAWLAKQFNGHQATQAAVDYGVLTAVSWLTARARGSVPATVKVTPELVEGAAKRALDRLARLRTPRGPRKEA